MFHDVRIYCRNQKSKTFDGVHKSFNGPEAVPEGDRDPERGQVRKEIRVTLYIVLSLRSQIEVTWWLPSLSIDSVLEKNRLFYFIFFGFCRKSVSFICNVQDLAACAVDASHRFV